jgi:hypothetical protein
MDLKVSDNGLSAWEVTENGENLPRVLVALAANCDHPTQIDYLIFDSEIPVKIGLKVQSNPGDTPDKAADQTWHRDLVEITGKKLLALATAMFLEALRERCPQKEILKMLKAAVLRNEIDRSLVPNTLLQKIDSTPVPPAQS